MRIDRQKIERISQQILASCVVVSCTASIVHSSEPLIRAHAHNDYLHERPLHDALEHGFCSVEVDIFLVDGKLLVAHTSAELREDRTLELLYLESLRKRIADNNDRVYRNGPTFTLLIDIKSDGAKTYDALHQVLARYADIVTAVADGEVKHGAVQVIISGNRAVESISADRIRFAGMDGRLSDLQSNRPDHWMPLISDRWTSHFQWRGEGPISMAERNKLRSIVKKAHQHGRRVRFWATPENETVWRELVDSGVDLINTDELARLRHFLLNRE